MVGTRTNLEKTVDGTWRYRNKSDACWRYRQKPFRGNFGTANTLTHSDAFWRILTHSEAFWRILTVLLFLFILLVFLCYFWLWRILTHSDASRRTRQWDTRKVTWRYITKLFHPLDILLPQAPRCHLQTSTFSSHHSCAPPAINKSPQQCTE